MGFPPYGASPPEATILPVAVFDIATPLASPTDSSESNASPLPPLTNSLPHVAFVARAEILSLVLHRLMQLFYRLNLHVH